nr:hypothetical protein CFP56_30064 [Quercus suber]
MATSNKVFLIGPGFIGGEVIALLHQEQYAVTALVRRQEQADALRQRYNTVGAVLGSLDDRALIAEQAAAHDIVIHTATADHLASVEAVLQGLQQRTQQGLASIYLHNSGTSVQDDNAMGAFKSEQVFHDNDRAQVESVPDDAPHRAVDLAIVNAQKTLGPAGARIAIMTPPLIYGCTSPPPFEPPFAAPSPKPPLTKTPKRSTPQTYPNPAVTQQDPPPLHPDPDAGALRAQARLRAARRRRRQRRVQRARRRPRARVPDAAAPPRDARRRRRRARQSLLLLRGYVRRGALVARGRGRHRPGSARRGPHRGGAPARGRREGFRRVVRPVHGRRARAQ